jgi:hypothetical protein
VTPKETPPPGVGAGLRPDAYLLQEDSFTHSGIEAEMADKLDLDNTLLVSNASDRVEVSFKSFESVPGVAHLPTANNQRDARGTKGWTVGQAVFVDAPVDPLAANVSLDRYLSTVTTAHYGRVLAHPPCEGTLIAVVGGGGTLPRSTSVAAKH